MLPVAFVFEQTYFKYQENKVEYQENRGQQSRWKLEGNFALASSQPTLKSYSVAIASSFCAASNSIEPPQQLEKRTHHG
jgi:hypothetical protein